MKTSITRLLVLLGVLIGSQATLASITDSRVTPTQRQLIANRDNTLSVSWQFTVAPPTTNLVSSGALVINPANGAVLTTLGNPLNSVGPGPTFVFNESFTISGAQVQTWLDQGLRRLVISRTFDDFSSGASGTENVLLILRENNLSANRSNPTGDLLIKGLRLQYAGGTNLAVVERGEELKTLLSVYYSGTGFLEGRWQVADPGSSSGNPVFRTLALVRKQLSSTQRTDIPSPPLPTERAGKYLVRFCVSNRDLIEDPATASGQCPIENLIVDAAYQVDGEPAVATQAIRGLTPNQQAVTATTEFGWGALPAAKIYQLQIFTLATQAENRTASDGDAEVVEPTFVTGMVLPSNTLKTALSELVRSKLKPGHRYLWRITAHDNAGQLLGTSDEATFTYQGE